MKQLSKALAIALAFFSPYSLDAMAKDTKQKMIAVLQNLKTAQYITMITKIKPRHTETTNNPKPQDAETVDGDWVMINPQQQNKLEEKK
jgi:hypothetical protein